MANRPYIMIKRFIDDLSEEVKDTMEGGGSLGDNVPFIDLPLTLKETGEIIIDRQDCEYSGDLKEMLLQLLEKTSVAHICVYAHVEAKDKLFDGSYRMSYMDYTEGVAYPFGEIYDLEGSTSGIVGFDWVLKFDKSNGQYYMHKEGLIS